MLSISSSLYIENINRYLISILKASNHLNLTHEANFALCENFFAVIDQKHFFTFVIGKSLVNYFLFVVIPKGDKLFHV